MLDLTKEERSAIQKEDFQTLGSILLEKEKLIKGISFPPQLNSVDEIREVMEEIICLGRENKRLVHQKWLENKKELRRISEARTALSLYTSKRKPRPRLVDKKG